MPGAEVRADLWVNEYITPWDVYQHGVTRVLAAKRTQYQDMQIVETGLYGKGLVLDGKWQSCTGDEALYHEPLVHPAMIQHGAPRSVLVLGGGEGATVREILRWRSIERVVMVDIDGEVVEACREHLPEMHQGAFDDPRTELIIDDAVKFLDNADETFDVVISDLSDPIEEGPSFQLFTREYIEKVRRVLRPDGFFVLQSGPIIPVETRLHARLYQTVKAVFPNVESYSQHVPTYAAEWSFLLASERHVENLPDPGAVDETLAAETTGKLKVLDGRSLIGMFQIAKYQREADLAETTIYTLADRPQFFGEHIENH